MARVTIRLTEVEHALLTRLGGGSPSTGFRKVLTTALQRFTPADLNPVNVDDSIKALLQAADARNPTSKEAQA